MGSAVDVQGCGRGERAILEMIARGLPLADILAAVCELLESQEPGLLCSILLTDEGGRHTGEAFGPSLPEAYLRGLQGISIDAPYAGSCCQALDCGEEVSVPDVARDTRFAPLWRDLNLQHGLRACRSIPIRDVDGRAIASAAIFRGEAQDTEPRDRHLLGIATYLAGIAIERYCADRKRATSEERLRLLWEAAEMLLTTNEPDAMLRQLFQRLAPHLKIDTYFNYTVDADGGALTLASCGGVPADVAEAINRLDFGEAVCGAVALSRHPIVAATCIQSSADPMVQLVRRLGIKAYACNPLIAGNRLFGTLSFATRTRDRFAPDELDFLSTLTHYVTAAYERLHLIGQMREADRRKDEFLAMLAHEMRNPLAPIRNGLEVMRRATGAPEYVQETRAMMERQLKHLVHIVDDLLDVSRVSRGTIELRRTHFDLAQAVRHGIETSGPEIEESGCALEVNIPQQGVYVDGDMTRLAQVVANLVNNAAHHTSSGGCIEVSLSASAGCAEIRVRDTGAGISPEILPCVFDLFAQGDRSLERTRGGLGIGLALVKALVEKHGGSVRAYSEGVGRGSEFLVVLPMAEAFVSGWSAQPPTGTVASPRRVLVVDDNRDAAMSLALLLRMQGHAVATAHDGIEALKIAATFEPDVVLLDIGMPRMNGYEAARHLRDSALGQHVKLVALTGWGQQQDAQRSAAAGFDLHLTKPADPAALEALLR